MCVCAILFSMVRGMKTALSPTSMHMDEMENNDPSAKVRTSDVNENKRPRADCVGFRSHYRRRRKKEKEKSPSSNS